jgi:hypothetical protein
VKRETRRRLLADAVRVTARTGRDRWLLLVRCECGAHHLHRVQGELPPEVFRTPPCGRTLTIVPVVR